ncbi:MAG: BON domain-containing protein [Smithella sp.]|nr:BON domain-containing protein [Syntrophaceae bacterium]
MKKMSVIIRYLVLLILIAAFAAIAACGATRTHESTGEYVDDSVITTKVKSLLADDDFLKSFEISVETYKGVVQLSGFVNSQKAVDKAGEIARSVKSVKSVNNNLVVK